MARKEFVNELPEIFGRLDEAMKAVGAHKPQTSTLERDTIPDLTWELVYCFAPQDETDLFTVLCECEWVQPSVSRDAVEKLCSLLRHERGTEFCWNLLKALQARWSSLEQPPCLAAKMAECLGEITTPPSCRG